MLLAGAWCAFTAELLKPDCIEFRHILLAECVYVPPMSLDAVSWCLMRIHG